MKFNIALVLVLVVFVLSSCYLDTVGDNREYTDEIVLNLVSQAPVGYAGTGYYLRARIYSAEDADAMESQGIIYIDTVETNDIFYQPQDLSQPLNTQAFFLGFQPPPTGFIVIVDLPSDEYRVLLEQVEFWGVGDGESDPIVAGFSDSFIVDSGENITINLLMHTYSN